MEVQIRLARKSDLPSILEISEGIYNGHDYFPNVFLRWLDEPNRRIMVAEKDNIVIALRAFHIIDEGKTVVSQSLRVHPEYRGQGVSAILIKAEHQYVRDHFSSVQHERYTTMSTNVNRLAIQRRLGGDSLLLEMGVLAFCVNLKNPGKAELEESVSNVNMRRPAKDNLRVNSLSCDAFLDLLEEEKLNNIIRQKTLIIDWEPFKALPSNIPSGLLKNEDCLFASVDKDKKHVDSLSQGRKSPRVKCMHWVATIYTSEARLLKIHITEQLKCAMLQINNTPFIFSCFLPAPLVSFGKTFVTSEFSLKYVDFFNFNLYLFEKDFSREA